MSKSKVMGKMKTIIKAWTVKDADIRDVEGLKYFGFTQNKIFGTDKPITIQIVEGHEKEGCEWYLSERGIGSFPYWHTSCHGVWTNGHEQDFTFCPYCGREIKIKEEE